MRINITVMNNIGFIGTGVMGKPMAMNILKKGYHLIVYARNREKAEDLIEQGAVFAESPKLLAEQCKTIVLSLPFDPEICEVITGDKGLLKTAAEGSLIIDTSTATPANAVAMAEASGVRGVDYIDAPVSGGVKGAIDGSLTFIVGGSEKAVMKAGPVFGAMGKSVFRVGDVGTGMTLKALNQIICALNTLTICETVVLGEKLGVSAERFYEVLSHCAANSYHLQSKLPDFIIPKSFDTGHRIEMMIKDLDIALDIANQNNVDMKFSRTGTDLYREGAENGYAGLDISSMSVYLSEKSK